MSMSQEEIEALMNGLDIADDEQPAQEASEDTTVNTDEIEELISQTAEESNIDVISEAEDILEEISAADEVSAPEEVEEVQSTETSSDIINTDEIDDLLKDLEDNANSESVEESSDSEQVSEEDFDDILAGIDGVVDDTPKEEPETVVEEPAVAVEAEEQTVLVEETNVNTDEIVKDWTDSKINEGVIPLPADKDTKVVNQLSQVANDSEEKVGQIFDVLSLGLDNNNELRSKISNIEAFIESESKLLNSLSAKFPNISVFSEHIEKMEEVNSNLTNIKNLMNDEDMKIFEAMELMQFNDINRQKIERVMSVIRKLSIYLNNLFEDDGSTSEIAVAKHIHGDSTNDLIGDDLDKLIAEFEK